MVTTRENLESRKASLSLNDMPATFRDAVRVCWKLNIRYLWIDALCILQFESHDFEIEAP